MPGTSPQKTPQNNLLYPNLNELAPSAPPPAYFDLDFEKNSEIKLKDQISSLIESGKTVYIAVDPKENNGLSNKRKLICILENGKGKISTKGYDGEEFMHSFSIHSTGEFKSKDKKVRAIIDVNAGEFPDDTGKTKKNKINTIDEIIFNITSGINFKLYDSYNQMCKVYDAKTGESIEGILRNLNSVLNEMDKKITKLNSESFDTSELEELLGKMKLEKEASEKTYNASKSHSYSFSSLVEFFSLNKLEFDKKVEQLNSIKKYQEFHNNLFSFQKECNSFILGRCYPEDVYEKDKIVNELKVLSQYSEGLKNSNSDLTEQGINVLQEELNRLKKSFASLKNKILEVSDKVNQDNQKDISSKTQSLFDELKGLLDEIEAHTPSKGKEKIKKDLVEKINSLLNLKDGAFNDLPNAIEEASKFITDNITEAKAYTGGAVGKLFGGQSVLGGLMHKLQELLDKFLNALSISEKATPSPSSR